MPATSSGNANLESKSILEKQLKICGFRKDKEVTDLYLGEKGLREVPDLSRFRILKYLWLNNNKIQNLSFLKHNCCLTELYLNNNEIRDIAGALRNIHSLQILLLHNNQLKNLDRTVKELQGMRNLQTLNLFNNPLSHDGRYHLYVIYHIPSVTLLDRKEITKKERESALHIYNHEKTLVLQSIGFGKRIDIPLLPKAVTSLTPTKVMPLPPEITKKERESALHIYNHEKTLVLQSIGFGKRIDIPLLPKAVTSLTPTKVMPLPPGCEFGNHLVKIPFENPEDAVFVRATKRSVMEFSTVDWEKMPTSEEKRLGSNPEKRPEKLMFRFK